MADGLDRQARGFCEEITGLLNRTICNGIPITPVKTPYGVALGYGLSKAQVRPQLFPTADERCWLRIGYVLTFDPSGQYLMVAESAFGIYADAEARLCLCRFDYERGKTGYPEAHLQVFGNSEVLTDWPTGTSHEHDDDCEDDCALSHNGRPVRELSRLHLPAGDRRYRPTLEDVIEFLVIEQLSNGRPGWRQAISDGRERWRKIQLRAAVHDNPEIAREALAEVHAATRPQRGKRGKRAGNA
jgi:hypothetical protein